MHNIGGKGLLTDFGLRVASCLGHEQDEVILRLTPCRLNHPDALQPTPSLCGFIFLDVFNGLQNHTLW